jgi:TolA-binding protein
MTCTARVRNLTGRSRLSNRLLPLVLVALVVPAVMPIAAHAQSDGAETTEARLRRIEGQLRALQRKVFPDGAGKTFAPEIAPGDATATPPPATGNAGALADILSRMDAVEAQVKALTANGEDTQNRLGKLENRVGAVETAQASAAPPPPSPAPSVDMTQPPPPVKPAGRSANGGSMSDGASTPSSPAAADRSAAVAAIERPSTDDKGEDAYTYGYRLWEAKFFPEAEAVLLDFVQQYPNHKRISYARNLLGRAYLDDNKPGASAQWFAQNYRADKAGDRAPDSLLYLAVAMTRLKETKRACIALGEFHQTYPTEADGRLKGQYDAVTKTVTCH